MPGDPETNDPLLRVIAELRADLNQWIDEQLAYVKERVEEPNPPRTMRPTPVLNLTEAVPPAPVEADRVQPLDPRQRLDALAKRLDHRRRLSSGPTPERAD
jgi:hypothetical protein